MGSTILKTFHRNVSTTEGDRVHGNPSSAARSVLPTRKYQHDGGPGIIEVLDLLKGSDDPAGDQKNVLKAQILFWLIGATDGHTRNFSIVLGPGNSYSLTPLYDVLTAQPSFHAGQIQRKQMKLAMSVGTNRHYRISEIIGRHFIQTGEAAGLPKALIREALEEMADMGESAMKKMESELPADFPKAIHVSVRNAMIDRLGRLSSSIRRNTRN